jgi:hypothetical protein
MRAPISFVLQLRKFNAATHLPYVFGGMARLQVAKIRPS